MRGPSLDLKRIASAAVGPWTCSVGAVGEAGLAVVLKLGCTSQERAVLAAAEVVRSEEAH